MVTRRDFFHSLAGAAAVTAPTFRKGGLERMLAANATAKGRSAQELAQNEDFWLQIQQAFTVDRSLVNLNNGGVSPAPKVVQDALRRYVEFSNQAPVYTMWEILEPQIEGVRRRLADDFGCDAEEMAITRNASEALEICQMGLDLEPGDEILTTDQDYGRMLTTWEQRVRREGLVLKKFSFPTPPPNMQVLVDLFEQNITPRTKVIHFCHITNLTGQIFPVKAICQMARAHGIETIVDGAHAYAHFPFTHADLDCDRYGTSLHKWLLAPHGTGFLYMRKEKIKDTWPLMAAPARMDDDIRKFEEIGTHPAGNHNAIAEALTFHQGIGAERKAARLRYLRDRFLRHFEGMPGIVINTSFDPAQSCGIGNLGIEGIDPALIRQHLWKTKRIIVVSIGHPDCTGLRVTPNVYTTLDEVDVFIESFEEVLRHGIVE
ncbi:MAG: aminotransferase class V-fold PLP-dependent enzyme [Gemmatimonadetes bacterium]|nr:aminotransferase class V-fold PLP-dependent enzyme [Gemmatimonadota bacterium]